MKKKLSVHLPFVVVAASLLMPSGAPGQTGYTLTASALGGLGGAFDVEPDPGFGNSAFQLGFSWLTDSDTQVGVRLGQLDFGGEPLGSVAGGDLTYLTVAGEYRFQETSHESGIYFGLGGYRLEDGKGIGNGDDTALGVAVGVTGEFPITRHWAILVEISAHYADLEAVQLFAIGHGGIAFRF